MKKRIIIIIPLLAFHAAVFSQSFDDNSIPKQVSQSPNMKSVTPDSLQMAQAGEIPFASSITPTFQLNDTTPAIVPAYSNKLFSRMPFFVNEQFSVGLGKTYNNFKYENITSVGTTLLFHPASKLNIAITPVISHYLFGSPQLPSFTDFSATINASYEVSNRMVIKGYGQVSTASNKFLGYPPYVPQNAYGVGVLYKVNKNIGIEVDMEQSKSNGIWYNEHNGFPTDY
jgi:hypothetical protein